MEETELEKAEGLGGQEIVALLQEVIFPQFYKSIRIKRRRYIHDLIAQGTGSGHLIRDDPKDNTIGISVQMRMPSRYLRTVRASFTKGVSWERLGSDQLHRHSHNHCQRNQ